MLPDIIETQRLMIRRFTLDDLHDVHRILDVDLKIYDLTLDQRAEWLHWSVLNYAQLAALHQPPYGDRAVVLKETNQLIGVVGLVPMLEPYDQLPYFNANPSPNAPFRPEVGLYYAFDPAFQRQGYATEAVTGLIDCAFEVLHLQRIIATTEYTNELSQAMMRRLGMTLTANPFPEPFWFQIVGTLENK
ncbi:MAG: GNAT family N-acetyltransferase [Chloroflexota bacterium]